LIFGILYIALVATHWGETPGGLGTLTGVATLFTNRWMLLAGWIHCLAFDLFIGSWEASGYQTRRATARRCCDSFTAEPRNRRRLCAGYGDNVANPRSPAKSRPASAQEQNYAADAI